MNQMIFLHLPKTAGTSLRNALDPHFSADEKLYLFSCRTRIAIASFDLTNWISNFTIR